MPRLDLNVRKRVISLKRAGYSIPEICKRICVEEDCNYNIRSVYRLWKKFVEKHTILDLPKGKQASKLSRDVEVN